MATIQSSRQILIAGDVVKNMSKISKNIKFLVIFESLKLCVKFKGKISMYICSLFSVTFSDRGFRGNGNYSGLDPSGVFKSRARPVGGISSTRPLVLETTVMRKTRTDDHFVMFSTRQTPGFTFGADSRTTRLTWTTSG